MSAVVLIYSDDERQWLAFRREDAIGAFKTWAEAKDVRGETTIEETTPTWTAKSGGY